jgi:hypothetical protein
VPTNIDKNTFTVNNLQARSLVAVIESELVAEFIFYISLQKYSKQSI